MVNQNALNAVNQTLNYTQHGLPDLGVRTIVLALVVVAHAAVLAAWHGRDNTRVAPKQLMVSFAMNATPVQPARLPQAARPLPPKAEPAPVPLPVVVQESIAPAEQAMAPAEAATPAPVVADIEPDYKAAYLNNPPPVYPMIARRNGIQGRVMLNVEVLVGGVCGKVFVHQSSGHAMLDEAALQTVKSWHFVPARHAGQSVDKWFIIPIQFSLRDRAA